MCPRKSIKAEHRTLERIRRHYEIERELAEKLKSASKEERKKLYSECYNELFRRVPDHIQLVKKADKDLRLKEVEKKKRFLLKFLAHDSTFLEIGSGDCELSVEIAGFVKKVYAIDVSDEISKDVEKPANFELIISDGSSVDVPHESIDIAYSHQLIEHLHPEDAVDQLKGIYEALVPGGRYICFTPHKFTGPHDISKYFDDVATCFHLKEYTNKELGQMFRDAGFSKVETLVGARGNYVKAPIGLPVFVENLIEWFPHSLRMKVIRSSPFEIMAALILGIRLIATK